MFIAKNVPTKNHKNQLYKIFFDTQQVIEHKWNFCHTWEFLAQKFLHTNTFNTKILYTKTFNTKILYTNIFNLKFYTSFNSKFLTRNFFDLQYQQFINPYRVKVRELGWATVILVQHKQRQSSEEDKFSTLTKRYCRTQRRVATGNFIPEAIWQHMHIYSL